MLQTEEKAFCFEISELTVKLTIFAVFMMSFLVCKFFILNGEQNKINTRNLHEQENSIKKNCAKCAVHHGV